MVVGMAVYGDGRYYYMYAKNIVFDQSLDITGQLSRVWTRESNNGVGEYIVSSSEIEFPVQTVGPSLLWAIPIFAVHILHQLIKLIYPQIIDTGYSDIYQIITGVTSIVFVTLGFYFLYKFLRLKYSINKIIFTFIILWATTNLLFYSSIDVINTHSLSFLLSSFILYQLYSKKLNPILTGLSLGLFFSNRTNDVIIFVPILFYLFIKNKNRIKNFILPIIISSIITASFQIQVWYFQFGSLFPKTGQMTLWNFNLEYIFRSLSMIFFEFPNGLIFTSPIIIIGLIGLYKIGTKERLLLLGALLQLLLICAWWSPFGGESYGPRLLISFYPFALYGINQLLKKRKINASMIVVAILLTILNLTNITSYLLKTVEQPTLQRITRYIPFI